ncbi:hypothetical protein HI914_06360 [Erysiphe necator]|uniref:Putative nad dependent epimerase dehydratase family protein n=1 Tax=Uncinula necator TaxID=52586 RepID=A0A0B1PGE5_UNCNE|nr:hypothetical protein HI914_06360 [Erysiphe necator]KHJ35644.1 putative nad dependent epimerase dehydratase family protein [Erysiphe necator]
MNETRMTTAPIKIVVCGGNGFLGSRICKFAVARGWDVTSLSRSGEPKWASVSSSNTPPAWAHEVHWERADILKPTTYSPLLRQADYVVHSLGILLEADYKGVISGQESPITGLKRAFSQTRLSSQNPLSPRKDTDLHSQEKDDQLTYELMNRDSAITLAQEAAKNGASVFAYISAAGGAPILPQRYITTKREAESTIASEFCKMRGIFFRPGFLYNSSRTFTIPLAAMTAAGAAFNSLTGGIFSNFMGAAGTKPLDADVVAEAVVEALNDESVKGPVEIKEIEELSRRAWRKGML